MESKNIRLGCVVMAAGNARRFGENKLSAVIDGRSLMERTLDAVPCKLFEKVIVVTQYDWVETLAAGHGFLPVRNNEPEKGLSLTIRLGLTKLSDMDGVLFLVSDQPWLKLETVEAEIQLFRENSDKIIALSHDGQRGNPCIFPKRFFSRLLTLEGDRGGSVVIRQHEDALLLLEADEIELKDIDTKEEFERAGN